MKRIQQLRYRFLLLLAQHLYICTSFTASPFNSFQFFIPSICRKEKDVEKKRIELKKGLLNECTTNRNNRANIVELIKELKEIRSIEGTATSPMLQREWLLFWTAEKEINLCIDWNISGQIRQNIKINFLSNDIQCQKGGSLSVGGFLGSITPNDSDEDENNYLIRTTFEFESATIDLAKWGSYDVPLVGRGWFDTVFLDE